MKNQSDHIDLFPILDIIDKRGIDFSSVLQESQVKFNFSKGSNGEILSNTHYDYGAGFYLNHGGNDAFHSTNNVTRVAPRINEIANKLLFRGEHTDSLDTSNREISKYMIDISNDCFWDHDYETKANDLVEFIENHLKNYQEYFSYNILIDGALIKKSYQSTDQVDIVQIYSEGLVMVELKSKYDDKYNYRVELFGGIAKEDYDLDQIGKELDKMTNELDDLKYSRKPKSGKYDVIFSGDTAFSLIHESIGHGCEADQIIRGDSFLTNKMGHKIASSDLSIIDDPHIRAAGWAEYDDEGVKTKGTLLVENGILVEYLHTRKTAKALNTMSTGNARAMSYISPPEPRQSNIFIEPRDHSMEELLEELGDGLLIGSTYSASTSIYTGEFMINVQYCYEVTNGEIEKIFSPVSISGNSLNVLDNIQNIGNDLSAKPAICTKDDSRLLIGALSPSLHITDIFIS